MRAGLYEEYERFAALFPSDPKPLQSLGYRHMGLVHRGELSIDEAVTLLKRDTRRFAKQQISWLRSERGVHWAPATVDLDSVLIAAREFLAGETPALPWADPTWASS